MTRMFGPLLEANIIYITVQTGQRHLGIWRISYLHLISGTIGSFASTGGLLSPGASTYIIHFNSNCLRHVRLTFQERLNV